MQYIKTAAATVLLGSLVACTTSTSPQRVAYETTPPHLSKQVTTTSVAPVSGAEASEGTYAVPTVQNNYTETTTQTTTLAPPGSNLSRINQTAAAAPAPAASAPVSTGRSSATLKMPYAQAWDKAGKALPAAGYPVMEQDSGSGTYYVLDKVASGGVIKRDTPIYQVRLEKQSGGTGVSVLNSQNQPADSQVAGRILNSLQK